MARIRLLALSALSSLVTTAGLAQEKKSETTPHLALTAGIAGGPSSGWQLRGDLNVATLGRVELGAGVSYWSWSQGCDAIVGGNCENDAFTIDAGATIRLGPLQGWSPYLLARLGSVQYGGDFSQWDASMGIGIRRLGTGRLGFTADARYHSLFSGASADDASAQPEDDYFTLLAGVVIRF